MLTINLIKNATGAAKYYTKEDNYYLSEFDAKEASLWWGDGASRLGINGKVTEPELQKMFEGKLPNGAVIGLQKDGKIKHRAGFDLCFQAPKSVSILALDGEDKRFYNAHLDAVKETLKIIERDCAQAKIQKDDQISFENTKNLTIALIRHTASRKLDLHLHTHALVINATQRQDNMWRALASSKVKSDDQVNGFFERIYQNQIYYGLIYKSSLASKVQNLGCEIEIVGKHGMWEIKGVPKEAREILSKRRKQIEEKIEQLNYRSLKAADLITLNTRDKKPKDIPLDEIKKICREELVLVGFSSKEFLAQLDKSREVQGKQGKLEKDIINVGESIEKIKTHEAERMGRIKKTVYDAIEHLSQYNLRLDYAKTAAQALEFSIGKANPRDITHALDEILREGGIITLDKSGTAFITKDLIETEKTIMDFVTKGKGTASAIEAGREIIDETELSTVKETQEAKEYALKVLQSKDRLSLVNHRGADNREFISAILNVAENTGKNVRVLSPSRIITNDINQNIKRKPSNLWRWLVSLSKPEVGESIAGFNYKYKEELEYSLLRFRQGKEVIIVDGAETLGCCDMKTLLELTEKTNARVIFLNDLSARQGFKAGNPIETLKQAGIERFNVDSFNRNQTCTVNLKEVQDDNKRTKRLARIYASCTSSLLDREADSRKHKNLENTVVLLSSKAQLKNTNEAIRRELQNIGKLSRLEHEVSVLNPVYLSKVESGFAQQYKKGGVIRFYDSSHSRHYTDWNIERVDKKHNILRLSLYDKPHKKQLWNPKVQEKNFRVFVKETISIAEGDKLIASANMRFLKIKNADQFIVEEINGENIKLFDGTRTRKFNLKDLEGSHLQYNYAAALSKSSKRQAEHVITDIKAYSLNKPTLNELTSRAQKTLTIFTDNAESARKMAEVIPNKLTAAETLFNFADANNHVDRLISDKTVTEIKNDIEKVVTALAAFGSKDKLDEKAEEKAVNFAIEKITSHKAGFTHKELVIESLEHVLRERTSFHNQDVTHEKIIEVITQKCKSGELVMGKHFEDGTRWTTKEIIDLERFILSDLKIGRNTVAPIFDRDSVVNILEKTSSPMLTPDQKNACCLIATTKDKFIMVQGYAGTGKTTMFAQIQRMQHDLNSNFEILALAPTHQAVKELKNVGLEAQTLKSFIVGQKRQAEQQKMQEIKKTQGTQETQEMSSIPKEQNVRGIPEQQQGRMDLDGKLIILDEASMVSNRDFADFLNLVRDSKAHIVLSGDIAQHIAIESGKPYEIAQRADILEIAYLREIVRQKNPVLKEAVENIIQGDYSAAFNKIAAEDQRQHIARDKNSAFADSFNELGCSVVEIDNRAIKVGGKTLEKRVAEDFLSRTPETRNKTVVIVHANEDRKVITSLIRTGLKEQGEIAPTGIQMNCLIPKVLTSVEHKFSSFYGVGDVVKFGKNYYRVIENDQASKSIVLKDEAGRIKYFYPEKYADKYNIELYEHAKEELVVGDVIKFTKTDNEHNRYANAEYRVKKADGNKVVIESIGKIGKNVNEKNGGNGKNNGSKDIVLDAKKLKDAHWDYAHTVTGYGIQGGSKTYGIDFEVSYHKNLASQRSFYIGTSRAIQHLIIYTNNKDKLLDRILSNKGDKYAALEVTGEIAPLNMHSKQADKDLAANDKNIENIENKKTSENRSQFYDVREIEGLLKNSVGPFVEKLLGKPNPKLSSPNEWRYGNKGSLAIKIDGEKRGYWYNFETGESGGLLSLLQKNMGLSFKDALQYAANVVGIGKDSAIKDSENILIKHKEDDENQVKTDKNDENKKTNEYAKKLIAGSLPITGTIVEKYLKKTRGIVDVDSPDIRYHPKVFTDKNAKEKYLPAMLCFGRDKNGNVQCVQATYLDFNTANKADIDVKKRTYSSPSGAAVQLKALEESAKTSKNDRISFITEGIETGLSVKDAVKKLKNSDVFATLGKTNFLRISTDNLGQKVIFCLDNDGEKTFTDAVIHKAAQKLIDSGKEVFIAFPEQTNDGNKGKNAKIDFNDVARSKGIPAVREHLNNAISYKEWQGSIAKILEKNEKISSQAIMNIVHNEQKNDVIMLNNIKNITSKNTEVSKSEILRMGKLLDSEKMVIQKNNELNKQNKQNIQKDLAKAEKEIY